MVRILALDLETTGVDVATARVTEVASALFEVGDPGPPVMGRVLHFSSVLCRLPSGVTVPPEVVKLNGITDFDLQEFGRPLPDVLLEVAQAASEHRVDYLCGHNLKEFDLPLLRAEVARMGAVPTEVLALLEVPVLDTLHDLPLPDGTTSRRLVHLAADHGFLVESAHRALFDALASLRLLCCYQLDQTIARAASPVTLVQAVVSFEEKDKAKELGFGWDAPSRRWVKRVKELDADVLRERAKAAGVALRKVAV